MSFIPESPMFEAENIFKPPDLLQISLEIPWVPPRSKVATQPWLRSSVKRRPRCRNCSSVRRRGGQPPGKFLSIPLGQPPGHGWKWMETGHPICVQNCLGFSEWLVNSVTVFGFCLSIPMIIIGVFTPTSVKRKMVLRRKTVLWSQPC